MTPNEQYSRKECLESSVIPASIAANGLESKVFKILGEIDVIIDPTLVEDCHCLPAKGSQKKVFIKLNRRKDIRRILLNKNKFKTRISELAWVNVSLMKVCACNARNCGPNVKGCRVLATFPRFRSAVDH